MSDEHAEYLAAAEEWYESERSSTGRVNTNVMNAGLIVSRMVRDGLPITDSRLYSKEKSQVKGLSGRTIKAILASHGETRQFTSEGGRTSRRTIGLAEGFRETLHAVYSRCPIDGNDRLSSLSSSLEAYFAQRVRADYFDKQTIKLELDPSKPVSVVISDILGAAAERSDSPTGAVLQHLVGAKLELRFPSADIGRDGATTADQQTDREGDFQIGTTAFHVTVSPMEKLIDRCKQNLHSGFRPVILTPTPRLLAARQMVENFDLLNRIGVQSAEDYIGTNVEELSTYDGDAIRKGLAALIFTYNERIHQVENDRSLMIEEPKWMEKFGRVPDNPPGIVPGGLLVDDEQ